MKAGLIIAGIITMFFAFILDVTLIGLILGIPLGIIGFIIFLIGLFSHEKPTQIIVHNTDTTADPSEKTESKDKK